MDSHDLLVIGGGAAGLAAAREGVRRGAAVLLVTAGPPGGDCTFIGCVPSKTLLAAARSGLDFPTAAARVRAAIARIAAAEDEATLRAEGIEVQRAAASLAGPGLVEVEGRTRRARRILLATGSRPAVPDIRRLSEIAYLTNENVFDLPAAPASLAVLGGGPLGCELAQAFARLGSSVTILEAADRLLPGEDPRAAAVLAAVFARQGIAVHTGTTLSAVAANGSGVTLHLPGRVEHVSRLLVATGRVPDTTGLGLAAAGVHIDARGAIVTDDRLATSAAGIYAAGDVTGRAMLTHAADEMGRLAAANALSRRSSRYRPVTPRVIYTDPEIAQVGPLERECAGKPGARTAYLPMDEFDRAITEGATDGFVLLVAGRRRLLRGLGGGRVLGATIVAARAGEMIAEPTLAMTTAMFTGRLAATTHAYPTWSGAVQQAAAQFFLTYRGRRAVPASASADPDPTRT